MHTLRCQYFTGTLKAGEDIVALKIGKLSEYTFHGIAPRQIFKDTLNWIAQTTNTGLAVTHSRVNRDAGE